MASNNKLQMEESTHNHQTTPKYQKVFTAQQLNLLNYSSIIEGNEFEYVYEPSDDTYLMLSALKHELPYFQQDTTLCEIGSGSGIISANLHHWLCQASKKPLLHVSIDLNMDASLLSKRHYDAFSLPVQQINTSVFNNLAFTLTNHTLKPEILIFNPPYVPVEQEEIDNEQKYLAQKLKYVREHNECIRTKEQNLIAFSYMGGLDGLQITRKILGKINWNCTTYFIVMGEDGLKTIQNELKTKVISDKAIETVVVEVLQYQQNKNEDLFVVKAILKAQIVQ